MGFNTLIVKGKGGIIMAEHIFNIIIYIFSYYFIFIDVSYITLKYISKDKRFKSVKFIDYLCSPVKSCKVFKGDK